MITAAAAAEEEVEAEDVERRPHVPGVEPCDGRAREEGLIVAYLDGELTGDEVADFERHVAACAGCARDLAEQRRVLCALNLALMNRPDAALPRDFSRVVIARAQSDMGGVRARVERRLALKICLGLAVCAALLPLVGFAVVASSAGVLAMIWRAASETASGATVVLRAVGRQLLFDSPASGVAVMLLFAALLALLPRLIINYHRHARSAE